MQYHIVRLRRFAGRFSALVLLVLVVGLLGGCGSGGGGSDYPSQDIRFLVGVSPGGGFDTWARTLAPYLEEYLPGDSAVVVENEPGAGGLRAANTIYAAEPDGYMIGITNTIGLTASQVGGQSEFDVNEFTWIGRLADDPELLVVNANSEFQSIADLQNAGRELNGAITSLGASTGICALLIGDVYGISWTPVTHEGSSEAILSVIRGDTDFVMPDSQTVLAEIEAGDLRPILGVYNEPRIEALPDVPMAADDGHTELNAALPLARDIAAPPDLPEDVKSTLTQAFNDSVNDPDFQAEIQEADLLLDPLDDQETASAVAETLDVHRQYEDLFREALESQ